MHISNYRVRRADCSLLEYVGIEPKYSWQPIRLECNWNKGLSVTIKSAQRTTHSIVTFIRSNWNTFTKETLWFCWYTPSTGRTTKTKFHSKEKNRFQGLHNSGYQRTNLLVLFLSSLRQIGSFLRKACIFLFHQNISNAISSRHTKNRWKKTFQHERNARTKKKINKETTPKTGAQRICSLSVCSLCVQDRRLFSRVVIRVLSIPCVRGVRELY